MYIIARNKKNILLDGCCLLSHIKLSVVIIAPQWEVDSPPDKYIEELYYHKETTHYRMILTY